MSKEKAIYDLLNQVDTDLEELEVRELSRKEVRNMKNRLMTTIEKKSEKEKLSSGKSKYTHWKVAAACATVLCLAVTFFSQTAYAKGLYYDITHFLGLGENLSPYSTVVEARREDQGVAVTLKEVIVDDDTMTVASVFQFDQERMEEYQDYCPSESLSIYINGHRVGTGASGASTAIGTNMYESVISYDVGELPQGSLDVELVYEGFRFPEKELKGEWRFAFNAEWEELAAETLHIPLNVSFTLDNGCQIQMVEYKDNVMGPKIDFSYSGGKASEYDLLLKGTDDLGNPVSFYCSRIREDTGRFLLENMENGNLNDQASSLTLTLFAREMPKTSGRITGEYTAVGTITLNLAKQP